MREPVLTEVFWKEHLVPFFYLHDEHLFADVNSLQNYVQINRPLENFESHEQAQTAKHPLKVQ